MNTLIYATLGITVIRGIVATSNPFDLSISTYIRDHSRTASVLRPKTVILKPVTSSFPSRRNSQVMSPYFPIRKNRS